MKEDTFRHFPWHLVLIMFGYCLGNVAFCINGVPLFQIVNKRNPFLYSKFRGYYRSHRSRDLRHL